MVQFDSWFTCDDGAKLFLRCWKPLTPPSAVVHIVHGMTEHGLRYKRLADKLCEAGIEVWAADQRGHGKTADLTVNGPGFGGLMGHCADSGGFKRVTADVRLINREIRGKYSELPFFLFGHSWGSFIVQDYIESYTKDLAGMGKKGLDGCILSGSRGPGGFKMYFGAFFLALLSLIRGRRKGWSLVRALVDGSYNHPFRPNRTSFDWLSRDEKEVDAYVEDPYCGNLCSTNFYRGLIQGLCRIHRPGALALIDTDLPLYVFSGSADPVGEMGASPTALVNVYRSLGVKDLEFVLYPDARHETLNETNRDEVMDNLLAWIRRHCISAQTVTQNSTFSFNNDRV